MRIRPATPDDLDAVAWLLTEVFAQDPLMSAIVAPAPDPRAALDHLHHVELASHYLSADPDRRLGARVDLAVEGEGEAERLVGTMLWDPPADGDPAGPLGPGQEPPEGLDLSLLGGAWDLVLLDGAQCEAQRPTEPHWYAYMIAVLPQARGTGTGTALLRHGLERVDADGLPAHLESTTPASRRLYERLGYREVAELSTPPLPTYWAMTRPAQATGR
ncbi:GNAT family N-acetyltransferase [Actinomyces faecalis]|uniref:GNAT family N-acetyltransferase n=1 Tax=Actinomyces faecalis TaxID=2722820 RepID=UPI0015568DB8|nr:GNAT family N-acetyltransferase [Actinomyces faecalis]